MRANAGQADEQKQMTTPSFGAGEAGATGERADAKASAASAGQQEIFARAAPALRLAGFAVLPAHGKEPTRKGFTKWRYAPSPRAVAEWAVKDPTANIVYVPGLCRTERGGDSIIVIDSDDMEAAEEVERRFGRTPGMVKTRRGRHAIYRDGGAALGNLSSLKKFGLNADLKHGRSIVVAPPSIHPVSGTAYAWEGCDPGVIRDLPELDARALQDLIDKSPGPIFRPSHPGQASPRPNLVPNVTPTAPAPGSPGHAYVPREGLGVGMRDGSRGLGLNDLLCKHASFVDSRDELLDVARTINQDYPMPLEDDEVVKRTLAVWKDRQAGKLQRWIGRAGNSRVDKGEAKHLSALGPHGGDAGLFLILLRAEHSARVRRGETFAINCEAMAKAKTLNWSRRRFRAARNVLLAGGYLKIVAPSRNSRGGRTATQYTLG